MSILSEYQIDQVDVMVTISTCEISGSHGGKYEYYSLLGYSAV
jgi:hypothetical protein